LKFLTRHGYIYTNGSHWTQKHLNWLRSLEFYQPLLRDVFDSYFTQMQHCLQRLDSLDKEVRKLAESKPYKQIVSLMCCFYGIDILTAVTVVTEIFEFGRFSTPGELMSYLGLTCSENSSGQKEGKGSITKTGNKRVRRLLIEASWHYRHPYNANNKTLKKRRKGQPQWAIDIADKAAQRLRKRYWYLINQGKPPCVANVAIARELAGFIWALFKEYEVRRHKKAA
jgi:transposase